MSGKSHERAEAMIERHILDPNCKSVCVREIQKSLRFSAYSLLKEKIHALGVEAYFDILNSEIRSRSGNGIIIFQGLQDHTADSIKSLEGFDIAWVEEAQSLSAKSIKILRPTIMRKDGAEMWFTWNPQQEDDAVEQLRNKMTESERAICVHVNFPDNPFLTDAALREINDDRINFPDDFDHIYLGGFDVRSDVRVFKNWTIEECEPVHDDVLYYGSDFGFAQDPTTLLRCWIRENEKRIYVDYQVSGKGIETDALPEFYSQVPESNKYTITADSARPENISYLNRHGYNVKGAAKGAGSVEDGIDWLRGYEIVVHPRCELLQKELRLYSYKTDKAGNILPKVDDKAGLDHCIDALRYALEGVIKNDTGGGFHVL